MKIIVNESQFQLLEMFASTSQCPQVIDRVLRPLEKLKQCKFTPDGKYVVYEGKAYNTTNGEEVPINESWTLSDILHTGADVLSMGLDFVIPGSGAVVDTLNALSYIIEAQFKSNEEKDSLYLMAAITFAFVILPGPLQAMAVPLKRAIKTGVGMASPIVVKALKVIGGSLDTLLLGIPTRVNVALKSPLAKNILGAYSGKISGFLTAFTTRTKSILGNLTGKAGKEGAEKVVKDLPFDKFREKFSFDNWIEGVQGLLEKLPLPNLVFNPAKVKVLNKTTQNFVGKDGLPALREVVEVEIENGQKMLFYSSSGSNTATTGKKAGEWFVIPGFRKNDGWFIKTEETIALTKGGNKYLTEMAQFLEKNGTNDLGKKVAGKAVGKVGGASVDNVIKLLPVSVGPVSKELLPAIVSKSLSLSKLSDVALGNNGGLVLSKLGFTPGKTFDFSKKTFKINDNVGEYVDFVEVVDGGKEVVKKMKVWDFLKTYIINPSTKLNMLAVPVITKATVRLFNNGTLNTEELNKMANIDSNQTQKDLTQLSALVAEYEGESGKYTVNNKAKIVQQSLMKLGYPLPRFKDDGKFGPETLNALKKFQQDNGLVSSMGKMDKLTARKLSELLKSKNIADSEELQNNLNSM